MKIIQEHLLPSEPDDRRPKAESHMLSDDDCYDILREVDRGDFEVSDWEAGFIESCLGRSTFSDKQKNVIQKLDNKYIRRTNQ